MLLPYQSIYNLQTQSESLWTGACYLVKKSRLGLQMKLPTLKHYLARLIGYFHYPPYFEKFVAPD
jgi:hypothetical protein